ncbi:MAG: alpha/beta fold hydrolase [Caldilineaceae bacterium]|nr:alpha/beta fold hydrolase [Caldilineaceae bacterium]
MPTIHTGEVNLYYEIYGEGKPLLLIAGAGCDHCFWRFQIDALAPYFKVVAFDNRGIGLSDKPEGPYSVFEMAEDTARLMEALDIHPAHVVGHALGGYIAQELALNYPGYVDHLVLAGTSFGGPTAIPVTEEALAHMMPHENIEVGTRSTLIAFTAPGFAEASPELFEELVSYRVDNPTVKASHQAQVLAGVQYDESERIHRLDALTLVITGEHDQIIPPGNASLLASTLPNAEAFILPDVGHIFPIETPELTNQILYEFLNM